MQYGDMDFHVFAFGFPANIPNYVETFGTNTRVTTCLKNNYSTSRTNHREVESWAMKSVHEKYPKYMQHIQNS